MISWYIWFVQMVMNKNLIWYLIEPKHMKIFYLDLHLLKLVWITKNIWFVQILNEKFDLILFDSTLIMERFDLIWFVQFGVNEKFDLI